MDGSIFRNTGPLNSAKALLMLGPHISQLLQNDTLKVGGGGFNKGKGTCIIVQEEGEGGSAGLKKDSNLNLHL